jgi:hypothetical protein
MNDEQLVARGTSAQDLLSNSTFNLLSKELLDHYISMFLSTAPNDADGRNSAYFQCRSLQDLIAVLQQWVVVKDNILSNNTSEEE